MKRTNTLSFARTSILILFLFVGVWSCKKEATTVVAPLPTDTTSTTTGKHTLSVVGVDNSYMQQALGCGATYLNESGVATSPLVSYKSHGMNYIRLRLFVNPNFSDPQVCNDLAYTISCAKDIKAQGYKFLLDIHYSDTWADPGQQTKPVAWANLSFTDLKAMVRSYTKDALNQFKTNNCLPDMVQVGNEITSGFLWPDGKLYNWTVDEWTNFAALWQQGCLGVKDVVDVPIMVHSTVVSWADGGKSFYQKCLDYGMTFDVIGLSYYPQWNGDFAQLKKTLSTLNTAFKKRIIVAETAYPTSNGFTGGSQVEPFTLEGQRLFARSVIDICKSISQCDGLLWWRSEETQWNCNVPHWNSGLYDTATGKITPAMAEFLTH